MAVSCRVEVEVIGVRGEITCIGGQVFPVSLLPDAAFATATRIAGCPPATPQTSGMAERLNGSIADLLRRHHFGSSFIGRSIAREAANCGADRDRPWRGGGATRSGCFGEGISPAAGLAKPNARFT